MADTLTVHPTSPQAGPVHVDQDHPLCHPDTREVTDTPLIRALLAAGRLGVVPPAPKRARGAREETDA